MKKTRTVKRPRQDDEDLLPEYRFDYKKAQPNRFAARIQQGSRVVVIDPDVAEFFVDRESVNAVLRALIETMPGKASASTREGRNHG
jgi:hypothetical protein